MNHGWDLKNVHPFVRMICARARDAILKMGESFANGMAVCDGGSSAY